MGEVVELFSQPRSSGPHQSCVMTLDVVTPHIGIGYAWLLSKIGGETLNQIENLSAADIQAIPGFGPKRTAKTLQAIKEARSKRNSIHSTL